MPDAGDRDDSFDVGAGGVESRTNRVGDVVLGGEEDDGRRA